MNRPFYIAVVDDDTYIRELVEACLKKEQYRTAGLASAEEALELWRRDPPDLWVLDIMLPGMDGYAFCQLIRREAEVPIIMISARDHEVDKVLGLELGSDDYLTKPFSLRELTARIKRLLHRWYRTQENGPGLPSATAQLAPSRSLTFGALNILLEERRIFWNQQEVELTMKEFELLHVLALHPNRAFTREELLALVWGDDYFGSDRAVDHLIKRVRKKMPDLSVEAVWGHGYRFRVGEAEQLEAGISD